MPKEDETLAAILEEMRREAAHLICGPRIYAPSLRDVLQWADRIEAAAERERNAHTNDIHDALYMATGIPGNAAAMREALIYVRDLMRRVKDGDKVSSIAFLGVVEHALAAPPRACDVLAKEQLANDIIKAIDEGVPGWSKIGELEKSLAYAVVNATVNAAYSTAVAKTDEPKDEPQCDAPAPDGAERDAKGETTK